MNNYHYSHSNMAYIVIMIDKKMSSDLLRGHTDTIILKFLLVVDKYGYEITISPQRVMTIMPKISATGPRPKRF